MADNPKPEEFPDGGRATLVRRFTPPLTSRHLSVLRHCAYEKPGYWENPPQAAKTLKSIGLLEEDPGGPGWFRVTRAGSAVVHLWDFAGFKS